MKMNIAGRRTKMHASPHALFRRDSADGRRADFKTRIGVSRFVMPTTRPLTVALVLLVLVAGQARAQSEAPAAAKPHDFARWEKDIAAFEAADRNSPPPKNAVLFVGSSTIVRWTTLQRDFPQVPIINRGFGGNQIVDSTHFADRMIVPYQPRMVFLRAGGNDINAGKSAEQVFEDFKAFVATVQAKLPKTEIVFIGLAPSIARWEQRDATKKLNALVADYVKRTPRLKYIDSYDISLDAKGQPRPELFVEDKLHFSPAGYRLLVERVRPHIPAK
jgi:lysophospholipase L1-like esterase